MNISSRLLLCLFILNLLLLPVSGKLVFTQEPRKLLTPEANDFRCCYVDYRKGTNISLGDGIAIFNDNIQKGFCIAVCHRQTGEKLWEEYYNGLNGSGMRCSSIDFIDDGYLIEGYPDAVVIKVDNNGKEIWKTNVPGFSTITGIHEDNFQYPRSYYFTVARIPGAPTQYGYMFQGNGTIAEIGEFRIMTSPATTSVTTADLPLELCLVPLSLLLAVCLMKRKRK